MSGIEDRSFDSGANQNITNTGCRYKNSKQIIIQIIDKKTSDVVLEQLDGFPSPPEVFIGRDGEIEDLRELFQKYQCVLIVGIGGLGKTRLAIEFAKQWVAREESARAVFINMETNEQATKRFESLGKKIETTDIKKIYDLYNKHKSLFVLDNLEEKSDVTNFLPRENPENIKILATSQISEYHGLFHIIHLQKLDEIGGEEFVKQWFKNFQHKVEENDKMVKKDKKNRKSQENRTGGQEKRTGKEEKKKNRRSHLLSVKDKDLDSIKKLVVALDGHPLALQHACAFCSDSILYEEKDDLSTSIDNYLEKLDKYISKKFPSQHETGYKKTIIASISLNVNKAIDKDHVRDFICTMCYMNPTLIELEYFRKCGYFSKDQIIECIRALQKYSIIHVWDDYLEYIDIHRLVLFIICLTMLRKDRKLEAHIVDIIFGMYFGDRRAQTYHGHFLLKNTNLKKKDLAGPYINAFQKSHFMSELRARLQRVDLTDEDLESWSVLHYCKFAEHKYLLNYFNESSEMVASENLDVVWPLELVELLKGNDINLKSVTLAKTVVRDPLTTPLHFYAAFGSNLVYFRDFIDRIEVAEIVKSSRLFNIATRNRNYHFGIELLQHKAKYEDKDKALMCAVFGEDLNLTRALIQEGAKVNFRDDAGFAPAFLAIATANGEILDELRQEKADIESALHVRDAIKNTTLLSVIEGKFVASHDYQNKEHCFLKYLFRSRSETQISTAVEVLINGKADVNWFDLNNDTPLMLPLMLALKKGYVDVVVKLINAGANVNRAKDNSNLEDLRGFLNKYWKWCLKFSRDPGDQTIHKKTRQEVQTHLEESRKNLKKLLRSTSDSLFKASIQDLDKKIEICLIGLKQREDADIDALDFSSFAKVLVDNLNASTKNAIHSYEYDAVGVLKTLAGFIFETRFELPANLFELYDKYVDIKLGVLFKNGALGTEIKLGAVRRGHQKLAVRLLLPEVKSLPGLQELPGEEILVRVGILTLKEGQLKYLNSSVAKYFLTEYMINNFNDEIVQKLFLQQVLIEDNFKLSRQFFDSQLEQFFENEDLVLKKSNKRRKRLNCLQRTRFHILSVAKFTDQIKETVRLILQEDKDFLFLKRVEDEDRAHIIRYLVNKFESDLDILLMLTKQSDQDGRTTYLGITMLKGTETFKALLDFLKENYDLQNLKSILIEAIQHRAKDKTDTLKNFLDFCARTFST